MRPIIILAAINVLIEFTLSGPIDDSSKIHTLSWIARVLNAVLFLGFLRVVLRR